MRSAEHISIIHIESNINALPVLFLEEVARIKLRLREPLNIHELIHVLPDVGPPTCVGRSEQRARRAHTARDVDRTKSTKNTRGNTTATRTLNVHSSSRGRKASANNNEISTFTNTIRR
jgi:hypothetical protein